MLSGLLIIEPSQALYYRDSSYPILGADNIIHPAYMERERTENSVMFHYKRTNKATHNKIIVIVNLSLFWFISEIKVMQPSINVYDTYKWDTLCGGEADLRRQKIGELAQTSFNILMCF